MRHLVPLVLADVPDETASSNAWLYVAVAAVLAVAAVAVVVLLRRRRRTPE